MSGLTFVANENQTFPDEMGGGQNFILGHQALTTAFSEQPFSFPNRIPARPFHMMQTLKTMRTKP
jgi:hypothetical protein